MLEWRIPAIRVGSVTHEHVVFAINVSVVAARQAG